MHLAPLIKDLSIILALAAMATLLFRYLKLPVVLGYLLAGFVVGPNSLPFPRISDHPNVQTWAEIGVIILMFSLGLEFSFRRLMRLGLPVALTGLFEIAGMFYLGFGASKLLGYSDTFCLFLGSVLAISSTTIIAKSFDELGVKHKGFAEFVFGLLIIEDLVAVILMVILSTPRPEEGISSVLIFSTVGKMLLVVGSWFIFGYYFLPRLLKQVAKVGNDESVVIFCLGLCFMLAYTAVELQFSSSLGAFIMGSILSEAPEAKRVEKLIRPIRDLFLAIFFVSVGMLLDPKALMESWPSVVLFSALLIFGKILFVTVGATLFGRRVRDGVRSGFSLTQIGEFSFILATLGIQKGSIDSELLSITVSISMVTTLSTPWMIKMGQKFADHLDSRLPLKFQTALSNYQDWWHKNLTRKAETQFYWKAAASWVLNGFVVITVFALSSEYLLPYMRQTMFVEYAPFACWSAAFLACLPFIWGMFWSFNRVQMNRSSDISFLVLKYCSRVGLLFLVGTLSGAFFEAKLALAVIVATTLVTIVVLYRRLEVAYSDYEHKFVLNFRQKEESRPFTGFFPWDAHLSKVLVPQESPLAGQTLSDANIRRHTGVSIVNVRRGSKDIVVPHGSFRIYPDDEMLVLGNDEQIQKLTAILAPTAVAGPSGSQHFRILPVAILPDHPFCGQKISDLSLLENYASILVGIERGATQIMSPSADFKIEAGDFVWLVGPTERLDQI